MLEVGTYCGYSALRLSLASLPSVSITTLEVDPVHAIIARNIIAFAGCTHKVDVLIGHSREMLRRLPDRNKMDRPRLPFDVVFLDSRGSGYDADLAELEQHGLLKPDATLLADNVLKPGAPLFLWRLMADSGWATQILRVREFAMPAEDWMSISKRRPSSGLATRSMWFQEPPPSLLVLHREADRMRVRASKDAGGSVTFAEWAAFADMMRERLAKEGIVATDFADEDIDL